MSRKRGNGEGSIYPVKDKSGRVIGYRGSYWIHTAEGSKRRYLSGKKREDVADKLAKALSNRADGLVFDGEHLTPNFRAKCAGLHRSRRREQAGDLSSFRPQLWSKLRRIASHDRV